MEEQDQDKPISFADLGISNAPKLADTHLGKVILSHCLNRFHSVRP